MTYVADSGHFAEVVRSFREMRPIAGGGRGLSSPEHIIALWIFFRGLATRHEGRGMLTNRVAGGATGTRGNRSKMTDVVPLQPDVCGGTWAAYVAQVVRCFKEM